VYALIIRKESLVPLWREEGMIFVFHSFRALRFGKREAVEISWNSIGSRIRAQSPTAARRAGFHGQRACGPGQSGRRDARRHVCHIPAPPRGPRGLINFLERRFSRFVYLIGAGQNAARHNFTLFRVFGCLPDASSDARSITSRWGDEIYLNQHNRGYPVKSGRCGCKETIFKFIRFLHQHGPRLFVH